MKSKKSICLTIYALNLFCMYNLAARFQMHSLCLTYFKDYLSTRFLFVLELFQKWKLISYCILVQILSSNRTKINFAMFKGWANTFPQKGVIFLINGTNYPSILIIAIFFHKFYFLRVKNPNNLWLCINIIAAK